MTEAPLSPLRAASPLRTPRAAAVAGIIFSVLLTAALVLLRVSVPAHPAVPGLWLTDSHHRAEVAIALNLVPFAGIAFPVVHRGAQGPDSSEPDEGLRDNCQALWMDAA